MNDFWGFDDEGETRGMWRRSGHPGFWFFGGIWRFVDFIRGCWLCRLRLLRLDSRKLDMNLLLLCDDMCSRRKSIEIYWGTFYSWYTRDEQYGEFAEQSSRQLCQSSKHIAKDCEMKRHSRKLGERQN